MTEGKTTNYNFDLITDNDKIKTAIKTKPNANWNALDSLLHDDFATEDYVDEAVPDEMTSDDADQLVTDFTQVSIRYMSEGTRIGGEILQLGEGITPPIVENLIEWNSEPDATGTSYAEGDMPSFEDELLELYAILPRTLTFDMNGGTGEQESLSGLNVTAPEFAGTAPEGSVFTCWSTSVGDEIYVPGEEIMLKENTTLYATYDRYVVDFYIPKFKKPDEYGYREKTLDEYDFIERRAIKANSAGFTPPSTYVMDLMPGGWSPDGWYTYPNNYRIAVGTMASEAFGSDPTLGPFSVRSRVTGRYVTFNLDANGGSVNPSTRAISWINQVESLPTPTILGYEFSRWVNEEDVPVEGLITGQAMGGEYSSQATLKAAWGEPWEVLVSLHPETTTRTKHSNFPSNITAPYGTIVEIGHGDRYGIFRKIPYSYRQVGWGYTTIDDVVFPFVDGVATVNLDGEDHISTNVLPHTLDLYAKWEETPMLAISDGMTQNQVGGADDAFLALAFGSGSSAIIPEPPAGFVPDGKVFAGWNSVWAGTGDSYSVGQEVTLADANITLYAQWTEATNE